MCYLWIRVVCVARMGPGVQRTKKNTPSGTFVLHRISNPENLLGRQKCYPYTNGVFFARSTDGCAATRADFRDLAPIRKPPTSRVLGVFFAAGNDPLQAIAGLQGGKVSKPFDRGKRFGAERPSAR